MATFELPRLSRFLFTDIVNHKGQKTLGSWPGFKWRDSEPTQTIIASTQNQGRPDLIAAQYLGSPDYWWAIMYCNNATDLNWPRAGDEVNIPNISDVLTTDIRQSGSRRATYLSSANI